MGLGKALAVDAVTTAPPATKMELSGKKLVFRLEGSKEASCFLRAELLSGPEATLADVRGLLADQCADSLPRDFSFLVDTAGSVLPLTRKQELSEKAFNYLDSCIYIRDERLQFLKSLAKEDLQKLTQRISEEITKREENMKEDEAKSKEKAKEKAKAKAKAKAKCDDGEENAGEDEKNEGENDEDEVDPETLFETVRKEVKDKKGNVIETIVQLKFMNDDLISFVRNNTQIEELYDDPPLVNTADLLEYVPKLEAKKDENTYVKYLLKFLSTEYEALTKKIEGMLSDGCVSYNSLWFVFKKGTKIFSFEGEGDAFMVGSEVESYQYQRSMWSNQFNVTGSVIKSDGKKFYIAQENWSIPAFKGTRSLTELPIRLLDAEAEVKLTARGSMFRKVGLNSHYKQYKGSIMRRSWWCTQHFKADGRVMVDGNSFRRCNPNYDGYNADRGKAIDNISDDKLFQTWPFLCGFSFSAKKWGEVLVHHISDIQFDNQAYSRLVLPEDKKRLVRALVENSDHTFSDLISGKGGGCIFLLHGPPGVGKTLTAEAIAELLHRPLYSVSVGELGTTTNELENKLREILEVAQTWNAVILIDEADIFLERRTEKDIQRNAMVGIFLRLLEYHQGVLFLTTNRVSCFDEAFHSRISVALRYDALTADARASVWKNLLEAAGVEGLDPVELSKYDINGRQIKSTIRLAQSLARSEGVPVNSDFVRITINVAQQFQEDIGASLG